MVTVDYQVGASANDGYWIPAYGLFEAAGLDGDLMGDYFDTFPLCSFARFTGVTIPAGATINVATLQLYFKEIGQGSTPKCTIYADDQVNPSAVSSSSDGEGRTKTTAGVASNLPADGTWWTSGSLVSVIQELVNSYSYASGSAMQLLFLGDADGSGSIFVESYDTDPTKAAKLHIEYTAAGGSVAVPIFVDSFRRRR